ncbi:EAL domain-containing protein [Iodobacter fluviatilis]|uniref:Uncharacterized protein n=1 Tax=Iodobacter fluviatilis TaxID=537 RepID=A0A7G3GAM2_9NEIS|nr:EAL domain-containing response regulator [Iodobacter fluviatilis]QBC44311.1 hypothetical protein C1H71_12760 [Iodobacter fluviatilis]
MYKVLVVDDHDGQRFIVCNMLKEMGLKDVVSVNSATIALSDIHQSSKSLPFDIVICDLQMPYMDGVEFVRALGKCSEAAPALIFMSSFDQKVLQAAERIALAYKIPVLGSIQKPILLPQLKALLEQKRPLIAENTSKVSLNKFSLQQIRAGLKLNQFIPFYQPKINLVSGECIGVEMLARWAHPVYGVLTPDVFSDIFIDDECCSILTKRLIVKSFEDLADLNGEKISLAINLAWSMFKKNDIADYLISQVGTYKINPERVIIEITESEESTDMTIALDTMIRLRLYGFKLALDDFGSGYSNMEVISSLPVNQLKIDKSLIQGVHKNKQKLKVLESVVDLSEKLALKIVAEGIETEAECNIVKCLGVTEGQGYYFSKPRSISSLKKYLEIQDVIFQ